MCIRDRDSAAVMGVAGSKKLPKEDMQFLMDNTNFTKQQIKAWYSGFMVRISTPLAKLDLHRSSNECNVPFCSQASQTDNLIQRALTDAAVNTSVSASL